MMPNESRFGQLRPTTFARETAYQQDGWPPLPEHKSKVQERLAVLNEFVEANARLVQVLHHDLAFALSPVPPENEPLLALASQGDCPLIECISGIIANLGKSNRQIESLLKRIEV